MIVDAAFSKSMANLVYFQRERQSARKKKEIFADFAGVFDLRSHVMIEWHQLLHEDSVLPIIRKAAANDADAVKACVSRHLTFTQNGLANRLVQCCWTFQPRSKREHVWLAESNGKLSAFSCNTKPQQGFHIDTVAVRILIFKGLV